MACSQALDRHTVCSCSGIIPTKSESLIIRILAIECPQKIAQRKCVTIMIRLGRRLLGIKKHLIEIK